MIENFYIGKKKLEKIVQLTLLQTLPLTTMVI